jgi:hypothetical protein
VPDSSQNLKHEVQKRQQGEFGGGAKDFATQACESFETSKWTLKSKNNSDDSQKLKSKSHLKKAGLFEQSSGESSKVTLQGEEPHDI